MVELSITICDDSGCQDVQQKKLDDPTFGEVSRLAANMKKAKNSELQYVDPEGDLVYLGSEPEWAECLRICESPIRLNLAAPKRKLRGWACCRRDLARSPPQSMSSRRSQASISRLSQRSERGARRGWGDLEGVLQHGQTALAERDLASAHGWFSTLVCLAPKSGDAEYYLALSLAPTDAASAVEAVQRAVQKGYRGMLPGLEELHGHPLWPRLQRAALACASEGCRFAVTGVHPRYCCRKCAGAAGKHGPHCHQTDVDSVLSEQSPAPAPIVSPLQMRPMPPPPSEYGTELDQLQQLGFTNTERNLELLRAYDGSVEATVDHMCRVR